MPHGREIIIDSTQMRGADGLDLLARSGRFSTTDPGSFNSIWREVAIDGLTIVEWTTSPLAGVCAAGVTSPGLVIVAVTQGLLRCHTSAGTVDAVTGSTLVLAATQQLRFTIPRTTRLLRIEAPATVAPSQVQHVLTTNLGIAAPTRLTASLMSLAEVVMDPETGGANCPAARAMRALTLALLDELTPARVDTDERDEIVSYIEAHLAEPDLGPQTIADAFGISIRWAHHLFNRENESISRHIRNRRIDLVAAQLRADRRFPRITAIAERHGFPSKDQLTRAFRARYGMTLADYAAQAAQGHAPQAIPDHATPTDDREHG